MLRRSRRGRALEARSSAIAPCILRLLALLWPILPIRAVEFPEGWEFVENAHVRVGVDLSSGGGICFLGRAGSERNLLNHRDRGRLIQQSYYGIQDGSLWAGKPWRWNPVQGGDSRNHASRILQVVREPATLTVRTQPRLWSGLRPADDVLMEQSITLEGPVVKITYTCVYSGTTRHPATHQETPAVFVDAALPVLRFYAGGAPWTDGILTSITPGFPNEEHDIPENWAAYTDAEGWGVGVFVPGVSRLTAYRYAGDGSTGPDGDACSYFAPIRTFAFDRAMTFSYVAYVTMGTVEEIRARFARIHAGGLKVRRKSRGTTPVSRRNRRLKLARLLNPHA
ncbi:MAG TPA: hypothetical protein PLS03_16795 [Terrimicrobiaceae bacterium]|nr:hypothetical protein [Terrimicrobiaceae bacterium]